MRQFMLPEHVQQRAHRRQGARRLTRLVIVILIGLAIIILLAMQARTSDSDQARQTAETFVIAMQSNDADKAYSMGATAFQQATTEEALGKMFDQIKPFVTQARIEQIDSYYAVSEKGSPRVIVVYTASKGSKVTYIRIVMDKQDNVWRVHSLLTKASPLQAKPE